MSSKEYLLSAQLSPVLQLEGEKKAANAARSFVEQWQCCLLQNCDLPPPIKLFPLKDEEHKLSVTSASPQPPTPSPSSATYRQSERGMGFESRGRGNSYLLRALQRSQTRAREAEAKALLLGKQNEEITELLLREELKLYAYKQWLKLLEMEILKEKNRRVLLQVHLVDKPEEEDDDGSGPEWCLALFLCLGFAGLGFWLGRYSLFGPLLD